MIIENLQKADNFTVTEQTLASYILAHSEIVTKMTIRDLSESAYVSASAITRLCRKLGLDGFHQLQVQLAVECNELNTQLRKIDANYPFTAEDSPKIIADKLAKLNVQQIIKAQQSLDYNMLGRVVRNISRKKIIYLLGMGHSYATMANFSERMSRIGHITISSADIGMALCYAADINQDGYAIVASHSGMTDNVLNIIKILHQNQTPTLLLTGNPVSPMVQYATEVCCIPSSESFAMKEKIESFGFQTALHYILDCIYSMVFALDYKANTEKSLRINQMQFDQ